MFYLICGIKNIKETDDLKVVEILLLLGMPKGVGTWGERGREEIDGRRTMNEFYQHTVYAGMEISQWVLWICTTKIY
jgi:hypothetical protein